MKTSTPSQKFISESIKPVEGTMDTARMAAGEPGLPQEFIWRKKRYKVAHVVRTWKDTGPCSHGSGEKYVRKNWYELVTTTGEAMTLYFQRRSTHGAIRRGWRLFSVS